MPSSAFPASPKVIVVTGASAGIGRAIVRAFAARYGPAARLALLARGRDGLEAAKADVEQFGGQAIVCPTDVASFDEVQAAADAAERQLGPIDIWVNDAMVSMYSPFMDMTVEEFKHITEVTYLGYVHGTRAALQRMLPRDRGVIVQVSSALAHRSIPLQSAYCGAKHAIQGFTESIRSELFHNKSNVRLALVALPGVNTPQFVWTKNKMPNKPRPTGAIFDPSIPADAVVFAAEHNRKEIWVGYPTTESVIGERLMSPLLDHYLAHKAWEGAFLPEKDDPNRPDNFWQPLPGDYGARGPFDKLAYHRSLQLWATKHRKGILASLAAVGLGAVAYTASRRRHAQAS